VFPVRQEQEIPSSVLGEKEKKGSKGYTIRWGCPGTVRKDLVSLGEPAKATGGMKDRFQVFYVLRIYVCMYSFHVGGH
jgi:hypothetical protein